MSARRECRRLQACVRDTRLEVVPGVRARGVTVYLVHERGRHKVAGYSMQHGQKSVENAAIDLRRKGFDVEVPR